jgi:regulatory protein
MSENNLFKTALNKAMALCSNREFCSSDIRIKLKSWGVDEIENEKIIGLLIKENFIDEKRFAEAFVKDKFNYNKWGKVKIAFHLRAKNIPVDILKEALNVIDNEYYKKLLIELLFSHRRFIKAKNQYDLKAKLLRYGLSKGFESGLLHDILSDLEE